VTCNYKANNGYLFILNKSFFFIKKPTVYIRHDEIASIEFKRASSASAGRSFDLLINNRDNNTQNAFTSIDRNEYNFLFDWVKEKELTILNEEDSARMKTSARDRAAKPTNFVHDAYMQKLQEEAQEDKEELKEGQEEDSEEDEDFKDEGKEDVSSESDEDILPEVAEPGYDAGKEEEPEEEEEGEGKKKKETEEKREILKKERR